ncbi:MAG: hypothetical protein IKF29_07145 [Oceanobacillus sp.]|nr:hypothetical protein [Oceanobacillus sp.]
MKAILVIDKMPTMCINCPCFKYQMDDTGICCADVNDERAYGLDMKSKPNWCPIKPLRLPNAKEQVPLVIKNENDSLKEVYEYGVIDGYNECVREVLGWNESNISN